MTYFTYYLSIDLKGEFSSNLVLDDQCWLLMTYILKKTTSYHHDLDLDKIYINYAVIQKEVFPNLTRERIYKIFKHLIAKGFLDKIKINEPRNYRKYIYQINNFNTITGARKKDV